MTAQIARAIPNRNILLDKNKAIPSVITVR